MAQLGEVKHVESTCERSRGQAGRRQLGRALPQLFLVISTSARYSRQNINTEAVQTAPDFIFFSESGHKAQSFYFKS